MKDYEAPQFNLENYPKSYGSLEGWRLHEYLHLTEKEQEQVYKNLEHFCLHRANNFPALNQFKNYPLIGSGWEWSVFAKDNQTVLKAPAGIFPEVNTPDYLVNAQAAYELMSQYYPSTMLANTNFTRKGETNMVEQARLSGKDNQVIHFDQADEWLLRQLEIFFATTVALIQEQHWLPDFWLDYDPAGFVLRNVMIHNPTQQFSIIDFTSYLDPARMYPALCQHHCQKNLIRVQEMLKTVQLLL